MFAFLKSIFRGRNAAPRGNVGLAIPRTVYTANNRTAPARRTTPAPRATQPAFAPAPEPSLAAPESDTNGAAGSDLDISLQSVLRGLPQDLQERVRDLDIRGATMTISLERILAQLPSGAVKISFGSLRLAAPQLFSPGADCDARDVALPLDEILAKINPAMVCPPATPPRGPIETGESLKSDTASDPDGAETARSEVSSPARGASLSVPPIAAPGGVTQESENGPTPRPATRNAAAKEAPIRVPTPQPAKTPATGCVNVELGLLSESWPAELRQEIAQWNLSEAKVALPAEPVREAMKRGRVAFSWGTLRGWITPEPPTAKSIDENATLELPLAIITPLFITGQRPSPKTPQMAELDEIPDLFFGGSKSETSNFGNGIDAMEAVESAIAAIAPAITPVQPTQQLAQPASEDAVMRIPLEQLTELWPEKVRSEVAQWNLEQLVVAIPAEKINAGLKQGKVVFSWENLRSWIVPTPPSSSLRGETLLELPLPVIMPAFLAGQKLQGNSTSKPCPVIDDDIPDPFADFLPPRANSTGRAQENAPAQSADEKPSEAKEKAAKGKKEKKQKGKTIAEPARVEKAAEANVLKREETPAPSATPAKVQPHAEKAPSASSSTPSEVLASAVGLEGVAGALVALSDGFKVASKLPAGLDGDALAAFLPHIFSKVNQSARELRMGDLTNLNFTVDNIPWKIFRVDKIFFAALGHAGQTMPTDQLAALAHKLTFKN